MKKILLLISVLMLVLGVQQVTAIVLSCTMLADRVPALYHPGESILWTVYCTATGDVAKAYTINIYNSTGSLQDTMTGNTGAQYTYFYKEWQIPGDYPTMNNSYGVFTIAGDTGNSTARFNVSGAAATAYLVISPSSTYNGAWYWDENNAVRAVVRDFNNQPVVGAYCSLDVYDSVYNEIFYTQGGAISHNGGDVVFNMFTDYNTFDLGTYRYEISCQYLSGQTLGEQIEASGEGSSTFEILPHLTNIDVFMESYDIYSTVDYVHGCTNVTNNYRYDASFVEKWQILCSYPDNVIVAEGTSINTISYNSTSLLCVDMLFPETASADNGVCYVHDSYSPYGFDNEMFDDYYDDTPLINVSSPFFTLLRDWQKTSKTTWAQRVSYSKNLTSRGIYTDVATRILGGGGSGPDNDLIREGYIVINGTNYYASLELLGNVQGEIESPSGFSKLWWNSSLPIVVGQEYDLVFVVFSTTTWMDDIRTALQSISGFLGSIVTALGFGGGSGIDTLSLGNYTNITGVLAASTIGTVNLTVNYNITAAGNVTRRNLRFVYEFAPIAGGVEGAFVDQNPSIEGYQALSVYQAIPVNITGSKKSFGIVSYPNLVIGNYTMYETVYEVDSPQQSYSGQASLDERLVKQAHYSIVVNQIMTPAFDGNVVQFNGEIMSVIS